MQLQVPIKDKDKDKDKDVGEELLLLGFLSQIARGQYFWTKLCTVACRCFKECLFDLAQFHIFRRCSYLDIVGVYWSDL